MRNPCVVMTLALFALAAPAVALTPAQSCEKSAAKTLRVCVKSLNKALRGCYADDGVACAPGAPAVVKALQKLATKVLDKCPDTATVAAAGYGPTMTPAALVARLQEACTGEAASLAARAFGGPHGAALAGADPIERECLLTAHAAGSRLVERVLKDQTTCVLKVHKGKTCDTAGVAAKQVAHESKAIAAIAGDCGATPLAGLVALADATFADAAVAQAGCAAAAALGDSGPLDLGCGPRAAAPPPARGVNTQVVLPEATWGSRCGDGGPYAFRVRLAPIGQPVGNIVVHMQGGGVCLADGDCSTTSAGLFTALDDGLPGGGIFSTNPANNPTFATWTHVYLPYCTQDLHIGGGAVSNFPNITVNRFGAVNVRAALRWVRDALWAELDATSADGYRPDQLRVVFAGGSAGGFGVLYNYQYVLDDLRWSGATAVPDAGLGLDAPGPSGIELLGLLALSTTPPSGWASAPFMPPYCFGNPCIVGPTLAAAHAARLLGRPEQRIMQISNQVDNVQVSTTLFPSLVDWINTLRATYCTLQGTPGLGYFLPASTSSIHTVLTSNTQFTTLTARSVTLRDWMTDAIGIPAGTADAVDEGAIAGTFGANPFSCPVAP